MAIAKANIENIYPLTPLQEGMLFHALLTPASPAYFQQLTWTIRGAIDPARLEASWNELIRRHAVLRTAFVHEGADRPLQIVLKERPIAVTTTDLRDCDDADAALARLTRGDRSHPFDLKNDPLLRVALVSMPGGRTELVWSHHHIVLDGWSTGLLLAELVEVYRALSAG